jgi:hypothetical protein
MDRLTGPDGYFTNPNGFLFREKSSAHKNNRVQSLHDLYKKRGNVHENDHLAASTYVKVRILYTHNLFDGKERTVESTVTPTFQID